MEMRDLDIDEVERRNNLSNKFSISQLLSPSRSREFECEKKDSTIISLLDQNYFGQQLRSSY